MKKEMNVLLDKLKAKLNKVKRPTLTTTGLPMTTKICHKVDYRDLERWAAEQLGIPNLEFVDMDNDTNYDFDDFDVYSRHNKSRCLSQADIDEAVNKAKFHGYLECHQIGILLSYFADAGLIPEGNYIVNFSW